jgi:hypothetical protein
MKFVIGMVSAAALLAAFPAGAATLAGLVGGDTLVHIDVDTRKVSKTVKIDGAKDLVGIDVRPADGMLYGVIRDGTVVTIDPDTGKARAKSKLQAMVPARAMVTIDFNPVADRLRILGSDGTNLRANVDDGMVTTDGRLKFAEGTGAPSIIAGAYSNSFKGTKETALYDIEANSGALVKQAPPNDGVLAPIGKLGPAIMSPAAFDIWSDGKGMNVGWLLAGGALWKVDLASGKAESAGLVAGLSGEVLDIAVLP